MILAVAGVAALATWDERREDAAALEDLGAEQSVLASAVANALRVGLESLRSRGPEGRASAPSVLDLLRAESGLERAGQRRLLLAPPGAPGLITLDGRPVTSPTLTEGLARHLRLAVLPRADAPAVGLQERTAVAGFASLELAPSGRWGVVAVATAAPERDRQARARWRLLLGVVVAAGLVLVFGGVALRNQREELRLERELAVAEVQRERDKRLLEAERVATMGTFAMGIVHEVSTPLGVITGRAEQLHARFKDDERTSRATQTILDQADHIERTIRRFLDLARGGPPSFDSAEPAEVVHSAASAVAHRFAEADVALSVDVPSAMPAIRCDRALLEHAITNLLLNACEACERGGHVDLAAREDAQSVAFVVTDDGSGIDPLNAARVAEPFFTTKAAGQGTGLGLAIATEIARSHRGAITLTPNAPRGTRACIEIPLPGGS